MEYVIRPPACAGTFYPADSTELARLVDSLLEAAPPSAIPAGRTVVSGVVPHAGYPYSASVAAVFYAAIGGQSFDLVYILAPAHRVAIEGMCVYDGDAFLTPLGTVPVDTGAVSRLLAAHPGISHGTAQHATEHAIEVQLPFLQRALRPGWKLVPILVGWAGESDLALLSELVFAESPGSNVLVIASSDLAHYPSLGLATLADSLTMGAWLAGRPEVFLDATSENSLPPGLDTWACGRLPMAAVLMYNRLWSGAASTVLAASTSAEASGDSTSVVGYASAITICDPAATRASLSEEARSDLCQIVERELANAAGGMAASAEQPELEGDMGRYRGVFVTYFESGALRGCIGTLRPVYPLAVGTAMMARAAALEDPRFPPIAESELAGITYEISVLTPLELMEDPLSVRIGTDGLLIVKDGRSGVLLPQVPAEAGWTTAEQFLEGLCQKAGLPSGSWGDGATLFRFQAEVFGPGR